MTTIKVEKSFIWGVRLVKNKIILDTISIFLLSLVLSCNSNKPVEPEIWGGTGSMYIDSSPKGAEIFLFGTNTNVKTPGVVVNLKSKVYDVTLKLNGCKDTSLQVAVNDNWQTTRKLKLKENISLWWTKYDKTNTSIGENYIMILKGRDNDIWGATQSRGVFNIKNGVLKTYDPSNSNLAGWYTQSISLSPNMEVWVVTEGGLSKYDGNSWFTFPKTAEFNYDSIWKVFVDNKSIVWVSVSKFIQGKYDQALYRFDGSNWMEYNSTNSKLPSGKRVTCMASDSKNIKWFGTGDGLVKYDDSNWEIFTKKSMHLPQESVWAIFIDRGDTLWLSTFGSNGLGGGLTKFYNNKSTSYNSKIFKGPSWDYKNDDMRSINIDTYGTKWIGTPDGMMEFVERKDETEIDFLYIYKNNNSGLQVSEIGFDCIYIDNQNNKWIGTWGGGVQLYKAKL